MLISSGQEEKDRSISSPKKKILPVDEDAGGIVEKVSVAPCRRSNIACSPPASSYLARQGIGNSSFFATGIYKVSTAGLVLNGGVIECQASWDALLILLSE